jgi:hypothetical protein
LFRASDFEAFRNGGKHFNKKTMSRQARSQEEDIAGDASERYDSAMSLAEIKELATQLPPEELTALTAFLVKRDQSAWDDQMEKDAASGKLDRLFEEAQSERTNGTLRDWPN